jgi:hypothetical protein
MKKIIYLTCLLVMSIGYAQKFTAGLSSGTQALSIEGGYCISEKIVVGGYYGMGFVTTPSAYGVFGRYLFERKELINNGWWNVFARPYLQASLGNINTPANSSGIIGFQEESESPEKNEIGYLATGGVEFLWGNEGHWGSFIEIGLGKTPNQFKAVSSSINSIDTGEKPSAIGAFSLAFGFRFYL